MRRSALAQPHPRDPPFDRSSVGGVAVGFFLLYFFYTGARVQPVLDYYHAWPVFRSSPAFRVPFLGYPGGLVDYAAALLGQLNYFNWLGAFVFTGIAALAFLATWRVAQGILGRGTRWAPFLTAFLLLLVSERYACPVLAIGIGLLAALLATLTYYESGRVLSLPIRLVFGFVSALTLFYVAGLWPLLLMLLLCGVFEGNKRLAIAWVFLLPALGAAGWCWWSPDPAPAALLNPWCRGALDWGLIGALFLALPVECIIGSLWRRRGEPAVPKPGRPRSRAELPRRRSGLRWAMLVAGLLAGWAAVWLGLDAPRRNLAQIDYYSNRKEYGKVLALAAQLTRQQMDFASESRLHLALYHTGRLGEDLFSFRNQSGWDLLPGLGGGLDSCRAQSRTLFELGLVSEAEHLAHEALESEGERPELLRMLAQVNVLKGRPKAARVFLNVLAEIPFQSKWAVETLSALQQEPWLTNDAEVALVRPLMLTNDFAHETFPAEGMLVQLLYCNSTNRMAFEYLMAEYLMNLQVNKVVDRLWQLDSLQYAGIPRHYEEALVLYERLKGTRVELSGRKVRPQTLERFQRFDRAMEQRLLSTEAGRQQMAREFGDTYWYYYFARQGQARQS